jgi:N4-gp56 family major capsid protein
MDYYEILQLADTGTGTSGIASITPEVWSAEVEQQAQSRRIARPLVKVNRDLLNRPGDVAHVLKGAKLTVSADVTTVTDNAEDAAIKTPVALDDYASLDLTPTEKFSSVILTKQVMEEVAANIVADASMLIAEALAQKEDQDILSQVGSGAGSTLFGGDATSVGTLADGDVLTPDLFANALRDIRKNDFGRGRVYAALRAAQENAFLKNSQFVNAAEFGSDRVVQNGIIGSYLGVDIFSSQNVPSNAGGSGGGDVLLWDSEKAVVLALKRDITMEQEYEPGRLALRLMGSMKYSVGSLYANAAARIQVTDA